MENLTSLLKKNPELRNKYVAVATMVADAAAKGLNKFVKHLLVVQNIDPNTQPGNKEYKVFSQQLRDVFDFVENNEYDGPRDEEVWLQKHLAKAQGKFRHLNKEAYKKLTDLSNVPDRKEDELEPLQVSLSGGKTIKEVMESETPTYTAGDQNKLAQIAAVRGSTVTNYPVDNLSVNRVDIKEALEILAKYSSKLEAATEPKEVVYSGRGNSVGVSRRFPVTIKTMKDFSGVFRRAEEEKK